MVLQKPHKTPGHQLIKNIIPKHKGKKEQQIFLPKYNNQLAKVYLLAMKTVSVLSLPDEASSSTTSTLFMHLFNMTGSAKI